MCVTTQLSLSIVFNYLFVCFFVLPLQMYALMLELRAEWLCLRNKRTVFLFLPPTHTTTCTITHPDHHPTVAAATTSVFKCIFSTRNAEEDTNKR